MQKGSGVVVWKMLEKKNLNGKKAQKKKQSKKKTFFAVKL